MSLMNISRFSFFSGLRARYIRLGDLNTSWTSKPTDRWESSLVAAYTFKRRFGKSALDTPSVIVLAVF
jgi:hypothetical protein